MKFLKNVTLMKMNGDQCFVFGSLIFIQINLNKKTNRIRTNRFCCWPVVFSIKLFSISKKKRFVSFIIVLLFDATRNAFSLRFVQRIWTIRRVSWAISWSTKRSSWKCSSFIFSTLWRIDWWIVFWCVFKNSFSHSSTWPLAKISFTNGSFSSEQEKRMKFSCLTMHFVDHRELSSTEFDRFLCYEIPLISLLP